MYINTEWSLTAPQEVVDRINAYAMQQLAELPDEEYRYLRSREVGSKPEPLKSVRLANK